MAQQIRPKVQVLGLNQLQSNIERLMAGVEGEELQGGLGGLAVKGAEMLESEATSQGWPRRAIESIFVYSRHDPRESRRRRGPAALFGFRKRGRATPYAPGYVEWNPARSASTRAKSLVLPGLRNAHGAAQKIGMSLATMFEFGTSKMRARPALRKTIATMRAIYTAEIASILRGILARHARVR